jgi:voltage-gated potassium channel
MALIDLAAILPFYVEILWPGTLDLRFLRVLRLLRIFRVLNVGPLAIAVGRLGRVAQRKRVELGVSMAFVGAATVLAAGAMYMVEHQLPDTQFTSIPRAMWWSIVTITTIGYGDITPASPAGQVIAGIAALVGICAVALPVAIISSGYLDEMNASKRQEVPSRCPKCGHHESTAAAGD